MLQGNLSSLCFELINRSLVKSGFQIIHLIHVFHIQNICWGYTKNRLNEHPKHMLKLIGNKIFTIFAQTFCLSIPTTRTNFIVFVLTEDRTTFQQPVAKV